jgi:D-erythrose 4-phosphate dehydrogenase
MFRVGINGYGRIGQSLLRALYSSPYRSKFKLVVINDLADIDTLTYLTRYDTTHGRFPYELSHNGNKMCIGEDQVQVINIPQRTKTAWQEFGLDLLFECSGTVADRFSAQQHLDSGANRILISHPATPDLDATIIYGFNQQQLSRECRIVSNGSCTTNCLIPVLDRLHREFTIEHGVTTTIHSAMNDQPVIDSFHNTNLRLTRSALQSIIPVDTGLAKGINRLMPELAGRFECLHVRVPTINVSVLDLSIKVVKATTVADVNRLFQKAAATELRGLLGYTEEPHASIDFNGDPHSVVVDGTQTRVCRNTLVKMLCWFDNEWAFANRMLDVANYWLELCR